MNVRRWLSPVVGALLVTVLVWRLGTGPVVHGLRSVDVPTLLTAALVTAAATLCCAWRWTVVAGALGVGLRLPAAATAYYRSMFLNLSVPGGVVGDVERGVRHGRREGAVARCLRAVVWERAAGQGVVVLLVAVVLVVVPSPLRSPAAVGLAALVLGSALVCVPPLLVGARARSSSGRAGLLGVVATDVRALLARRAWPAVVVASTLAAVGHVVVFGLAARAVGVGLPPGSLLPVALLVLLAGAVPVHLAGWGPREGVTVWAFSTTGLGADQGLATSVVYGVLVLAAAAPGALVVLAGRPAAEVVRHA